MKYSHILTKDFLIREYEINKKSRRQIAKEFNINTHLGYYFKKWGIKTREVSVLNKERGLLTRGENSHCWVDRVDVKCAFCGKEMKRVPSLVRNKENIFCSCSCRAKFRTGEKAPAWQGGLSFELYSGEFNGDLKEKIRRRDNYICQICGMVEEESLIVYGENLHCHHIDYDKKNNGKENLISLCRACHTRTNFNRTMWKEKLVKKNSHGIITTVGGTNHGTNRYN